MPGTRWLLLGLYCLHLQFAWAEDPSYIKTNDGVIVFTDPAFTGTSNAVKLEVVAENNYNYEKGKYSIIPIKYTEALKTIIIGERKGEFDGMPEKKIVLINVVSPNEKKGVDTETKTNKEIIYERKKQ